MTIKVYDWIAAHANINHDKVAVEDLHSGRTFTYGEMSERIGNLADHLKRNCHVEAGDRVAVLSYNNPEMLELQFACTRLGAIFVPLNFRLAVPELEYIVSDCTAKVLIADVGFKDEARKVAKTADVAHVIITNSDGTDSNYEKALAAATPLYAQADLTLDDTSAIMYTSGTTGHPKGCLISHSMALFNAVNLAFPAKITMDSVQFTFMPLFHTGGLNVFTLPVLHAGGKVILVREFDPGEVLRVIGDPKIGVTHFIGVPAMLLFMMQHPDFEKTDFTRMVSGFVGGAPVPVPTLEAWLGAGANIQQGYGMTETGPSCLALRAEDSRSKIGSTGKPVTHIEVKVVDEEGNKVPTGEMGELWVKGPSITKGYWNNPDAKARDFTDGWLHTGDAARVDDEGFTTSSIAPRTCIFQAARMSIRQRSRMSSTRLMASSRLRSSASRTKNGARPAARLLSLPMVRTSHKKASLLIAPNVLRNTSCQSRSFSPMLFPAMQRERSSRSNCARRSATDRTRQETPCLTFFTT